MSTGLGKGRNGAAAVRVLLDCCLLFVISRFFMHSLQDRSIAALIGVCLNSHRESLLVVG